MAAAVIAGSSVALGLLATAAVVLGVGQRVGIVAALPPTAYTLGTYAAGAAGAWLAGRLSRRRGVLVGVGVALVMGAVALWAGPLSSPKADGATVGGADWSTAAIRLILAAAVCALAGALGMAP